MPKNLTDRITVRKLKVEKKLINQMFCKMIESYQKKNDKSIVLQNDRELPKKIEGNAWQAKPR